MDDAQFDDSRWRQALLINKYALDDELIRQPQLYSDIAEAAVRAQSERDAAKENLDVVDSSVAANIRSTAQRSGTKVTEASIQESVILSEDHRAAHEHFLKCKSTVERLLALKEAFQQRSFMLRDLVALHIAGYYTRSAVESVEYGPSTKERVLSGRKVLQNTRIKNRAVK